MAAPYGFSKKKFDDVYFRDRWEAEIRTETAETRGISDHELLRCSIKCDGVTAMKTPMEKEKVDWGKFTEELKKLDADSYTPENDPDVITETLIRDLESCRTTATKRYRYNGKNTSIKPWISKTLLEEMEKRDRAWLVHKGDPNNAILRDRYKKNKE